jgi:hypothetical protein
MTDSPKSLTTSIAALGDAYNRRGDHQVHCRMQEISDAAHALRQRIAAALVRASLPADCRSTLTALDALL